MEKYLTNVDRITKDTVVRILEEEMKFYEISSKQDTTSYKKYVRFFPRFVIVFLRFIKKIFFLLKSSINNDTFYPAKTQRYFSISFISYLLQKNDVSLDMSLFPHEDREEIIKFLRNHILIALHDYIDKRRMFSKEDMLYEEIYGTYFKKYVKIKRDRIVWTMERLEGFVSEEKEYILPRCKLLSDLVYSKMGVENIPQKIRDKIKNRDIVDGGAYIGDSALVFYNYLQPRRIYALEPDPYNYSLLKRTISMNKLENKIIPINYGLYNKESGMSFAGGSGGTSRISTDDRGNYIEVVTIDTLVKKYNIVPGLIKLDIEGYEKEAIEGAISTLKKYKPVLLIALYHTAKDFFEIPPLIKSVDEKYRFRFLNLKRTSPYSERFLLAYIDE